MTMRTPTRRLLLAAGLATVATGVPARTQDYRLVPGASQVIFLFSAGGLRQSGTLPVDTARISVDLQHLERSRATVTADIRKISTGVILLTQAIKSEALLDADKYPTVTFQSRTIRLGAGGRISSGAEIDGDLTLRGVTRPITFSATLARPAGKAADDLSNLIISLSGSLNRHDFGASGYAGMAAERVDLDIRAEIEAVS